MRKLIICALILSTTYANAINVVVGGGAGGTGGAGASNALIGTIDYPDELWPKFDSLFYYKVGGGRVFTSAPRFNSTTLSGGIKISISGLSCGKFDPKITISNLLNNVSNNVDDAMTEMTSAATAAISNLPAYVLQTVDPGLYDLFMNSTHRAEAKLRLSTKNCEQIASEISKGKNPYEDLIKVSVGDYWKKQTLVSGSDISEVGKKAEVDGRNQGITYLGGAKKGGVTDDPIVVTDVVKAGYNMLLDRPVLDTTSYTPPPTPPGGTPPPVPPLAKRFKSPDEVQKWTRTVFGDKEIKTCDSSTPGCGKSKPIVGTGIKTLIEKQKEEIYNYLNDIYSNTIPMTIDNLSKVSAPGVVITRQVIEAIQEMDDADANVYLSRILDEVATSRVINDALFVRETVKTGMREANVDGEESLQKEYRQLVADIDEEIDNLMREARIKKELMSQTITEALIKSRAEIIAERHGSQPKPTDKRKLDQGVIRN